MKIRREISVFTTGPSGFLYIYLGGKNLYILYLISDL